MKRPAELVQLLIDLQAEKPESGVITANDSKMVMTFEENQDRYEFTGPECQLILSSGKALDRLYEALDYPEESFIELHNLDGIDPGVMERLEDWAATVDEM
jgi:hypothetical protein